LIYDPLGRLLKSERVANLQVGITDPNGAPQSRLVSVGGVLSSSSTAYDPAGRVRATTNALGAVTWFEYDVTGRRTATIDALNNRTDYTYDGAGRLRFITNALHRIT